MEEQQKRAAWMSEGYLEQRVVVSEGGITSAVMNGVLVRRYIFLVRSARENTCFGYCGDLFLIHTTNCGRATTLDETCDLP